MQSRTAEKLDHSNPRPHAGSEHDNATLSSPVPRAASREVVLEEYSVQVFVLGIAAFHCFTWFKGVDVLTDPRALELQPGEAEPVEACQQSPACQCSTRAMQGRATTLVLTARKRKFATS